MHATCTARDIQRTAHSPTDGLWLQAPLHPKATEDGKGSEGRELEKTALWDTPLLQGATKAKGQVLCKKRRLLQTAVWSLAPILHRKRCW